MSFTYQDEKFADVQPEIALLIDEHWNEVTSNREVKLDPDWPIYAYLDNHEMIRVLTVRHDGLLVGYIVFILAPLTHYRTHLCASDDAFFLKREYRKGSAGIRMFSEAEKMLKGYGVNRILYHEKLNRPMGKVFKFLNYTAIETRWSKEL